MTTAYFLYDGAEPVCELDDGGDVTAVNTFGANGLVSRHAGGGSVFYTFDTRGDATGYLSGGGRGGCQQYAAFGQFLDDFQYPFLFGAQWGAYTDAATGLTLMTHRFYDPAAGRFLTRDPAATLPLPHSFTHRHRLPFPSRGGTGCLHPRDRPTRGE